MSQRVYFIICGVMFFVVAAAHLTRMLIGWEIEIAGWVAPHWISLPGTIVPGVLSAWGFVLASRSSSSA